MRKKLSTILLIDDDHDDNFYHELIINEMAIADSVDMVGNGIEALEYLTTAGRVPPELVFLDLNMPKMNGWEFLEKYEKLDLGQKAKVVILILSTSANPDDIQRSKEIEAVSGYESKPLSKKMLTEILEEHFKEYL